MKKFTLILGLFILAFWLNAQTPQSFSYQAVVRNASGNLVKNQNVTFRASILQTSTSGTVVYSETHTATSNEFGLVTLKIGGGTVESGNFSTISWGGDIYFLKVEMDPAGGTSYVLMGYSQLLSVPYALYSEKTAQKYTAGTGIDITSNVISNLLPDKTVSLAGTGGTQVTGTYPSFSIYSPVYKPGDGMRLSNDTFHSAWMNKYGNVYNTTERIGIGTSNPGSRLTVTDTHNCIFASLNQTYQKGTGAIRARNMSTIAGSGFDVTQTSNAILAYTNGTREYQFAVAGYRYDANYGLSGGVAGFVDMYGNNSGSPWGALGYKDGNLNEWGGYFQGKISASDTVKAKDFKYQAPKEHYASFGAENFVPMYPGMDLTFYSGVYISSSTSAYPYLRAPINLPDNATVLEVKFYLYDNSTTSDIDASLRRVSLTGGGATAMAGVTSSGANTSITAFTDNTISYALVSNQNYYYELFLDFNSQTQGSSLKMVGAVIKYSLPEPD